jgi:hypothetical protein
VPINTRRSITGLIPGGSLAKGPSERSRERLTDKEPDGATSRGPTPGANPTRFRSSGGVIRDTLHPEPGSPIATLGRGLPRIRCVRLGSARQLAGLNVVRRLPLRSLMEWAVVLFPVLSAAAAGYLLDGAHVQDIARAFAK